MFLIFLVINFLSIINLVNCLSFWYKFFCQHFQKGDRLQRQLKKDWLIRIIVRENVMRREKFILLLAPAYKWMLFRKCLYSNVSTGERKCLEIKTLKCLCREKHVLAMQEMVRSRKFTWWWVTCVNMKIHFYLALIYVSSTILHPHFAFA